MTTHSIETAPIGPDGSTSYDQGYFDGELDAISKLPARMANDRASMAEAHDPLWAQGYADGFLHQIQVTYALVQKEQRA